MACDRIDDGLPADLPQELFTTLAAGGRTRIERIVSRGHASPPGFWYDQEEHEWVMLLEGEALLRFEDRPEPLRLTPGCHVSIAARRRHRVEWTKPEVNTVWLAVFYETG
ncbi:cupin 2 domain-containing protein [Noviherbaspirillum humi]|uniref:Cupin 2 domain-containing protein n=1 Tax=Noviherbaspirillum humi TaxID=1688639 RepID=A0A239BQE6_9BURK|nr:cupin domain-containing protein [Noviherbaspirillum humi]SNS10277.1 cupin 2 domain-containing protein [Noviherbaspirillum humi]